MAGQATISADVAAMESILRSLESECLKLLDLDSRGEDVEIRRNADVPYRGQAFRLNVALPGRDMKHDDLSLVNEDRN